MKVILLKDIRGAGKRGEIREFKDGYARNFLIPKGMAKAATNSEIKKLKEESSRREVVEKTLREKLHAFSEKLSAEPLEIHVSAGEKGELFASVGSEKILGELHKKYSEQTELFQKARIKLEKPIKSAGEYKVKINLGLDVNVEIKLRLQP